MNIFFLSLLIGCYHPLQMHSTYQEEDDSTCPFDMGFFADCVEDEMFNMTCSELAFLNARSKRTIGRFFFEKCSEEVKGLANLPRGQFAICDVEYRNLFMDFFPGWITSIERKCRYYVY